MLAGTKTKEVVAGWWGWVVMGGGGGERGVGGHYIYLTLRSHHHNDFLLRWSAVCEYDSVSLTWGGGWRGVMVSHTVRQAVSIATIWEVNGGP